MKDKPEHDCEFFKITDVGVFACECDPHHIMIDDTEYVPLSKYETLESELSRIREENERLTQWKKEQIEVWGPVLDWFQNVADPRLLGKSVAKECLRRSMVYRQLKSEKERLEKEVEELRELLYRAVGGMDRIEWQLTAEILKYLKDTSPEHLK